MAIILFACKKDKEEPAPVRAGFEFPFSNVTLKIYPTKQDWLNETNPYFNEFSATGKFDFIQSFPEGAYFYDVYDPTFVHHNYDSLLRCNNNRNIQFTDISKFEDLNQYRYLFLKDQKESNWVLNEYGGTGVESPACQPLRTMHIDKEGYLVIKDNELCSYQAHKYLIAFSSLSGSANERYLNHYEFGLWTETNFKVLVVDKVNGEATKLKIYDKNNAANYEIYTKQ
ncbi:MAG: hypothetical protein H7282_08055 [Cytophagaceae bacterium]|nr:hypothetical protein [Cytophagaceae bacterium]